MTRKGNLRQSDKDAIKRYHEKNYKRYSMVFRYDTDADIIEALDEALAERKACRVLIREWFDEAKHNI